MERKEKNPAKNVPDMFIQSRLAEEQTMEKILSELLNPMKRRYITEIPNPIAITALDLLKGVFDDEYECGYILRLWLMHFRDNMISFRRKRSEEIVKAVSSYGGKPEEEKKSLGERLLGASK